MTSLFKSGAGGGDPKGPVRKPLHPDERAGRPPPGSAPPPSERGTVEPRHRGVGVFRLAGWGWGVTIALVLIVGLLIFVGYLRDDPGRNPAPSAYRTSACAALVELNAGVAALEAGVDDPGARTASAREIDARVVAANEALEGLPEWTPGHTLDELLGSLIITLLNGADALGTSDAATDLQEAHTIADEADEQFASDRYGFSCAG